MDMSLIEGDLGLILERIDKALLLPPSNHPLQSGEKPLYEVEVKSFDDIKLLKVLHEQYVIAIETPGILGFMLPATMPATIAITIKEKFDPEIKKQRARKDVEVKLGKVGNELILETPHGNYLINSFKPGSDPGKIFDYLMNHEGELLKFKTIKLEADCVDYRSSFSDMARIANFDLKLKEWFMPVRSKSEVRIQKSCNVNQTELAKVVKNLRPMHRDKA